MDIAERNQNISLDYLNWIHPHDIMDRYSISRTQLDRILLQVLGKGFKNKRDNDRIDKIIDDLNNKLTIVEIALKYGMTTSTVKVWIKKAKNKINGVVHVPKINNNKLTPIIPISVWNTYDWLYEHYITKNLSSCAISKMVGYPASKVCQCIQNNGIILKNNKTKMEKHRKWNPTKEEFEELYEHLQMSANQIADLKNINITKVQDICLRYGFRWRSASENLTGDKNPMYGKSHSAEVKEYCKKIGTIYGNEYWNSGTDEEKELKRIAASEANKIRWSDPIARAAASDRITKLCMEGKCNSYSDTYINRFGEVLLVKSSWEKSIAKFLDSCDFIKKWQYESILISYMYDDAIHNFIVDFCIEWHDGSKSLLEVKNKHLLSQDKEQFKITEAKKYCNNNDYDFILITNDNINQFINEYNSNVKLINDFYFKVKFKDISKIKGEFSKFIAKDITYKIKKWNYPNFSDEYLKIDLNNVLSEDVSKYSNNGWKSTVATNNGMYGRYLILNFNNHFYDVHIPNKLTIPEFYNKHFDKLSDVFVKCVAANSNKSLVFDTFRLIRNLMHYESGMVGLTSQFAPGFARAIIRYFGMSGKRIFDPCVGWGGRLLGAFAEGCEYSGVDLCKDSCDGAMNIAEFIGYNTNISNESCLVIDWPDCDMVFTSPPFYNKEEYLGSGQPWLISTRKEWVDKFVKPFIDKCGNKFTVLYLDRETKDDFELIRKFDDIIEVSNIKHSKNKSKYRHEFLCIYKVCEKSSPI